MRRKTLAMRRAQKERGVTAITKEKTKGKRELHNKTRNLVVAGSKESIVRRKGL